MDTKINQNFAYILRGLLVALGANMAEKASQKGAREGDGLSFLFFFDLEGSWGPLGGSWGPRKYFNRSLVDV